VTITVLSAINGYEKKMFEWLLEMDSHITVFERGGIVTNWELKSKSITKHPDIIGAAPYIRINDMMVHKKETIAIFVRGVLPKDEMKISNLDSYIIEGKLLALEEEKLGIVIGKKVSETLKANIGSKVG